MPPPHIELDSVSKTYWDGNRQVVGVANLNMAVARSEFIGIVGHSGCGKTTLLNLLAGLIEPTERTITVDGSLISGPQRTCGLVFQEFSLFPWRTVLENVEFGLEIRGVKCKERLARARQYLQLVGLTHVEDSYPKVLSGGMKQRVAIARALAYDPAILLMDEPFGALDTQTRDEMQEELLRIWSNTGKTIVFVTHSIREAIFLAKRVFLMKSPDNTISPGSAHKDF